MADRVPPDPTVPSPPPDEVDAALAVLGLGDGVPNDAARELVALATAGVALADTPTPETIVPVAPPAGLRARLLDRIRREQRFQFVHADEGQWTALPTGGGHAKLLYDGGRPGERTRLLRLPAGDTGDALADLHDPALLVVAGELWRGDVRCAPGDFAQSVPNDGAQSWRAATPATVLVVERGVAPAAARRAAMIPAGASGWRTMAPGTRVRPLAGGPAESVDVMLLEMDAGSVLPEHEHGGLEEIFLLRGSCRAQGRSIRAGDYHRAAHGSEHEDTTTDEGCLMLVVLRKAA
ncbi:ChrR-like cupin domain protein (plasmid) [Gemmatirosa kalamazoonensis]|uniref:ChrR-like cupin domain protein n=1 Tax=Gemmatirosa kalamazoonensis TaxID=861299 RepID=W0RQE3_9BACT|nr:ChrR-like cupin domain protein [Gemmatirosa kalamazoonensis]